MRSGIVRDEALDLRLVEVLGQLRNLAEKSAGKLK
jgi:hypothetical protein